MRPESYIDRAKTGATTLHAGRLKERYIAREIPRGQPPAVKIHLVGNKETEKRKRRPGKRSGVLSPKLG